MHQRRRRNHSSRSTTSTSSGTSTAATNATQQWKRRNEPSIPPASLKSALALLLWDVGRRRVLQPLMAVPVGVVCAFWRLMTTPFLLLVGWPLHALQHAYKGALRFATPKASKNNSGGSSRARPSASPSSASLVSDALSVESTSYRSVTIKARIEDVEQMECALFQLTQSIGHVLKEEDVYFSVPAGQMKLRTQQGGRDDGQLISYRQTNNSGGPNIAESRITQVQGVAKLRHTLALSLEELGTINKRRRIYARDNFRASLDEVDGLGCFVDIDIHSTGVDDFDKLFEQAKRIQEELGISGEQLVSLSYLDLINGGGGAGSEIIAAVDSGIEEGSTVGSTC